MSHSDLKMSNNLQINGPAGNKFHGGEYLTTAACMDDPNIIRQPPPVPLDTLIGIDEGTFNKRPGYRV